jgi:hypothetical protein
MREHVAKTVVVYTIEDLCRSTKEMFVVNTGNGRTNKVWASHMMKGVMAMLGIQWKIQKSGTCKRLEATMRNI